MTSRGTPRRDNHIARASMCSGKSRLNSAHAAWKRAKRALRRKGKDRVLLHPYRCPFCGGWHLGTSE